MARCFLIYWLSVSEEEQERHFQDRAQNLLKRSKLSDMDFKSRDKWIEYSKVKDEAFFIPISRRRPGKIELPPRKDHGDYERPPHGKLHFVDEIF